MSTLGICNGNDYETISRYINKIHTDNHDLRFMHPIESSKEFTTGNH